MTAEALKSLRGLARAPDVNSSEAIRDDLYSVERLEQHANFALTDEGAGHAVRVVLGARGPAPDAGHSAGGGSASMR